MKSIGTLVLGLLCSGLFAQFNPEKPELCQGRFYSPEEAQDVLAAAARLYGDTGTWETRAASLRAGILAGAEISKMRDPKPLQPVIHSKKTAAGYTVENVFFESIPGFYVTGNLYRPLHPPSSMPGILCPHGHGNDGRLQEYTQQRCATLARMGATVFAYDMIGMGDSHQCDHKIDKAFKLQLLNSIRALDFISSLPGVDTSRLAVTGESGGGTQTFMLAAVDDRIDVAVPVVMVSAYFFGGCVCESGMPVHKRPGQQTTNAEIAATIAPRPLLLISDGDDWTAHNPDLEYPFIRHIYAYYGATDQIENVHFADEKHDYGPTKRQAAYRFLGKHLQLDLEGVSTNGIIDETPNHIYAPEELAVFTREYPLPANALHGNEQVMQVLDVF